MIEIVNPKIHEILMRDKPMFINRIGGSDAILMFTYYDPVNKSIRGPAAPIEYIIGTMSLKNGYYDLSTDPQIRKRNLLAFFEKLDKCYKSNEYHSAACIQMKGHPYFQNAQGSYFIYHGTIENPTFFLDQIQHVTKGKTVLIVSPFVDLISKQVLILDKLYAGKINLACNFKFVEAPITYYDPSKGYLNTPHKNFLETVLALSAKIDTEQYDIAFLGCGSYANLLGEHIKNKGKKAIYIGGILPSYFGLLSDKAIFMRAFPNYFDFNYVACLLPEGKLTHTFVKYGEALSDYLFHRHRFTDEIIIYNHVKEHLKIHVFTNVESQAAELQFIYIFRPLLTRVRLTQRKRIRRFVTYIMQYAYLSTNPTKSKIDAFREYLHIFK